MEFLGRNGNNAFFASGDFSVVIDESSNSVVKIAKTPIIASSYTWASDVETPSDAVFDLATAALTTLNIEVFSSSDRMHTIPKAVVAEAKRGLEWRKEENRGGTPVGMNTARTLADGGQIGIKKIRHIAKYFPRHEVDKKGKGWKPGEDNYPSNGRIAWALWGGDAAWKWARAIVEREDKKAVTAGAKVSAQSDVDLSDFAKEDCQFVVRVREGGKFDRLYQIKPNGDVYVWDNGSWDDLGNVENDIDTYDRALDDPYDRSERRHIPIDAQSAITLAALFDSDAFSTQNAATLNAEEWSLFSNASSEIDWAAIDSITAAGKIKKGDGVYTKEERSAKAKKQARDATGQFAKTGTRVQIGNNPFNTGVLKEIDAENGMGKVLLDSGDMVDAPIETTRPEDPNAKTQPIYPEVPPINVEGILGEPQTRDQKYVARLFENLPIIGVEDLHGILSRFSQVVQDFRAKERQNKASYRKAGEEALKKAKAQSIAEFADSSKDEKPEDYKSPDQSDVKPMYFAIVANDDPQAVMDVVALVPKSAKSSEPSTFRRKPGKWERDDKILEDLNSPTPPPVVQLDQDSLEDVLSQVDSIETSPEPEGVTAAGGLDRNRGNAEKLRRYWLYGKGAAKIRWNTPGDWTRCVRHLTKYMGPRSKGYCALRHKEATGMWTGDKAHRATTSIMSTGAEEFNNYGVLSEEEIIQAAVARARVADAKNRVMTAGGSEEKRDGAKFFIPLVIPEETESGDGRIFDKEAIDIRELPLPLLWQIQTGEGHNGSVVVGRIDHMERTDHGIGNARGVFDAGEYGKEAERLVRGGFIRGVSADLDKFEASEETAPSENADEPDISTGRIKISKARVMAVTLVPKPAFQECSIKIVEDEQEDEVVPDGVYVEGEDPTEASALVACGMVAGAIPTEPPSSWFENPKLNKATPLTVDEEGRVFGHIAAWHVDHIGMAFGTKPPRSRSGYAYFHTGVVRTSEGSDIPVGQLTLAGGHASLELSASEAVRHYDDTASAIADVHAGEDAYGIWVAGALRPGTTPEQIRSFRASAPSGDWRPIKGHLELVAVCQVNVPGFPVARSRVASGQVMALVAAGASTLAHMKEDPMAELQARIDRLERPTLETAAEEARRRVLTAKAEELAAKVKKTKKNIAQDDISWMTRTFEDGETDAEAAVISTETRKKLADKGQALPDGSYPIRNASDLKNAIRAFGRAKASERTKVRKHIVKRARALGKTDLIPENWPEAPKKAEASVDEVPSEGILAANDGPCWEGYEMVGWKEKDGKKVPNCVPVDASVEDDPAIPENWKAASALEGDDAAPFVASLRERIAIVEAMVSAGGLDRNRGNAERLRRYWTKGAGAAKIRWGTPGDWKRCVRHLSKYMGPRAKGYCQLRHKEATGVYTGSRLNPGRRRNNSSMEFTFSEALYGEGQIPATEVTEDDMLTPLEWILAEEDPDFDAGWEPEEDIILIFTMDGFDDDYDLDDDEDFDNDDFDSVFAAKEPTVEEEIVQDLTPEEIEALRIEKLQRSKKLKVNKTGKNRGKYVPGKTQPRDAQGKFRKVLARLKLDLGTAGLDKALKKVEEIENLDFSGDYSKAAEASEDLIGIIDRLDTKALNPESLENVRASSEELGKVIANLPFAFGEEAQKLRYSDLPPDLRRLIEDMIERVEAKIGKEDADIATEQIRGFMSGQDMYNQSEISGQLAKMLRLLT